MSVNVNVVSEPVTVTGRCIAVQKGDKVCNSGNQAYTPPVSFRRFVNLMRTVCMHTSAYSLGHEPFYAL